MLDRIKSFFGIHASPRLPELRKVDVGKAIVFVRVKGKKQEHVVELMGTYIGPNPFGRGNDLIVDAGEKFARWRSDGESGTLSVGGGEYVPLCSVESIIVEYEEHIVEVPY